MASLAGRAGAETVAFALMSAGSPASRRPGRVSRQVERAEERKGAKPDDPAQPGRLEKVGSVFVLAVSLGFTLVARFNDVRAFKAVVTPSLYCWLLLCLLCTVGVYLTGRARRAGLAVPRHFRLALLPESPVGC